jgi:hypothetical protein
MRRLYFFLPALFFLSCAETARNENSEAKKSNAADSNCTTPLNPNGDSELALLMRDMVKTTQAIQDSLEQKKSLPSYPEHFGKIFFAKKTDSTINKDLFNGLANGYINSLKYFYASAEKEKINTYNGMVGACESCHENFCQGPIKRIQRFYIR